MDMRIEVVILPVSDVRRAKAFYEQAGFVCDTDHEPNPDFHIVQLTPPGSACSIIVGKGIPQGEPGSVQGTYLVVEDLSAAVSELAGRGVPVSEPFHFSPGGPDHGPRPEPDAVRVVRDVRRPRWQHLARPGDPGRGASPLTGADTNVTEPTLTAVRAFV
jgi:catechol 2,3-dioxygenase-like lactoylglutathione lyase family enzyme